MERDTSPRRLLPSSHAPASDEELARDLGATLQQIVLAAHTALGAEWATCYAVDVQDDLVRDMFSTEPDPEGRALREASIGRGPDELPMWRMLSANDEPLLVVTDASTDPRLPAGVGRLIGARAMLCARLEHDSVMRDGRPRMLGSLFCTFGEGRRFAASELAGARGIALLASLALANTHLKLDTARSLAQTRALEAEQAALRRVATAVARADGDAGAVYRAAAQEAALLLGVRATLVVRFDGDHARVVGGISDRVRNGDLVPIDDESALGRVARNGREALIVDYADLPAGSPMRDFALRHDYRAAAAAPVVIDGHLWGALAATTAEPDQMPPDAAERLARFAELVGVAIANAEASARLMDLSTRDPLTGLANHRAFFEHLGQEVERGRRRQRSLSLVVMDLDHFKHVNDRHGHLAGDAVLLEFAGRVSACARAEDTLGRIGGEEFAWLLPECTLPEAMEACERARRAVAQTPMPQVGTVTMSAGVAERSPGTGARELFVAADDALYRAKTAGRNRSIAARD